MDKDILFKYLHGVEWEDILVRVVIFVLSGIIMWYVSKIVFGRLGDIISKATKKKGWAEDFIHAKAYKKILWLPTFSILYFLGGQLFPRLEVLHAVNAIVIILVLSGFIVDAVVFRYDYQAALSKKKNNLFYKSYVQFFKLIIYIVAGFSIASVLFDTTSIIATLGASTAVLMLVFKDVILGFISGMLLTSHGMLKVGDWIEMAKNEVDGAVIEVNLTTVKVQNWDNTIVNIPAYNLMNESFKNWEGMTKSGGRRIKRYIYIDARSVRFCSEEDIEKFAHMQSLKSYIASKKEDIENYNASFSLDKEDYSVTRRLTNVGCFRQHLLFYLKNHKGIRQDMTMMVRQKQPSEFGLPIEIYCFTNTTDWVEYELLQSDIFDHIYAISSIFNLTIYQRL